MLGKVLIALCLSLFFIAPVFAINITIEINRITVRGGQVHIAVYSNEIDYKNEKYYAGFVLEPTAATMTHTVDLPEGEYVVAVFQDVNGNGVLDYNFFRIPKEPVGITNYDSQLVPGGFQKLKVPVNSGTGKITVNLRKI
jgi:uncharacterized protein (DUF2141 family)